MSHTPHPHLHIDPPNWFAGMKNPKLQLMVCGRNIGLTQTVTTSYRGVTVEGTVRLDSPNYLFVYLDISGAEAGTMTLHFDNLSVDFMLLGRKKEGWQHEGFTNADVLYMLMPDRFAQGKHHKTCIEGLRKYREDRSMPSLRHGGDLEGIRQHLKYFNQLGVTALWLTPVLENNSADDRNDNSTYHGYATTDFYRVDPRLGSNKEYCQLVADAHSHGLKIVMDMIFNHVGEDHPWLSDLPSADWLNGGTEHLQTSYKLTPVVDPYAAEIDKRETTEGWFVASMPDLNQHNRHLMRYLIQTTFWWIETADIDGIRMDTYPYAFADGMAQWARELNDEYPNFNVVGETWVTEPAYTAVWQQDSPFCSQKENAAVQLPNSHLKSVMDFSFFDKINRAKGEETDEWFDGYNRVYNSLVYDFLYSNPDNVMAFLDNHDTDRFLGDNGNASILKQALALLLTVRRTPQIYYGTEILMGGTKASSDGNVRRDFPGGFPGDAVNCFTAKGRTHEQQRMFRWLSRLLHWRQGSAAVACGRQTQFIPQNGIYVLARQTEQETVITIINGTSHRATMHTERYAEVIGSCTTWLDVPTGRTYSLASDLRLSARQCLVLTNHSNKPTIMPINKELQPLVLNSHQQRINI